MPRRETLRLGEVEGVGTFLAGEYWAKREVFVAYYDSLKGSQDTPHVLFSRCGNDPESIMNFVAEWGPLEPTPTDDWLLSHAFPDEREPSGELHFAFFIRHWIAQQQHFKNASALIGSRNASERRSAGHLWPHWTLSTLKRGGLYLEADFGTPLKELFEFWRKKEEGIQTKHEAKALAERMGIFAPESPGQVRFKLAATTLWDAFWLMLAFDYSVRRITLGHCADPNCQKEFLRDRANKRYCSHECAQRVASRSYERKKRIAARKNEVRRRTGKRR